MNSVLAEIYSTIIPSAPFIIAAYVFIWVALLVWIFVVYRKQNKLSKQLDVIEGLARRKNSDN